MPYWNVTAPDYNVPTTTTPAWVWSIVGRGYDQANLCDALIVRLDYVKLDASGGFVRVLNFRPGWSSGACTAYIPVFMQFSESLGAEGTSHVAKYDHWASQGANAFWKNYIYKFLKGMMSAAPNTVYLPLPALLP